MISNRMNNSKAIIVKIKMNLMKINSLMMIKDKNWNFNRTQKMKDKTIGISLKNKYIQRIRTQNCPQIKPTKAIPVILQQITVIKPEKINNYNTKKVYNFIKK
jgi:hypothetical protein